MCKWLINHYGKSRKTSLLRHPCSKGHTISTNKCYLMLTKALKNNWQVTSCQKSQQIKAPHEEKNQQSNTKWQKDDVSWEETHPTAGVENLRQGVLCTTSTLCTLLSFLLKDLLMVPLSPSTYTFHFITVEIATFKNKRSQCLFSLSVFTAKRGLGAGGWWAFGETS